MKAFVSSIFWLVLLVLAVVGSLLVWLRPKSAPIKAVRRAVAEAAKSTVESVTDRKFQIEEDDEDDLPKKPVVRSADSKSDGATSIPSRPVVDPIEQARKKRERDVNLRALVYPKAQEMVRKELAFPQMAKFSALQPDDDQYSACRRLKGSVWESRGVTDHLDATGRKQRSTWVVVHRSQPDGTIQPLYLECGSIKRGSADDAMKAAAAEPGML